MDEFLESSSPGGLLAQLVELAAHGGDAAHLLTEDVVLERVDGTLVRGRAAVCDAVSARGSEARLRLLHVKLAECLMAVELPGMPGHFRITLRAQLRDGALAVITMTA